VLESPITNHRYIAPTDLAVANFCIAGLGVALFTVRLRASRPWLAPTSPTPMTPPIDLEPLREEIEQHFATHTHQQLIKWLTDEHGIVVTKPTLRCRPLPSPPKVYQFPADLEGHGWRVCFSLAWLSPSRGAWRQYSLMRKPRTVPFVYNENSIIDKERDTQVKGTRLSSPLCF
jgi:hypothetical protein